MCPRYVRKEKEDRRAYRDEQKLVLRVLFGRLCQIRYVYVRARSLSPEIKEEGSHFVTTGAGAALYSLILGLVDNGYFSDKEAEPVLRALYLVLLETWCPHRTAFSFDGILLVAESILKLANRSSVFKKNVKLLGSTVPVDRFTRDRTPTVLKGCTLAYFISRRLYLSMSAIEEDNVVSHVSSTTWYPSEVTIDELLTIHSCDTRVVYEMDTRYMENARWDFRDTIKALVWLQFFNPRLHKENEYETYTQLYGEDDRGYFNATALIRKSTFGTLGKEEETKNGREHTKRSDIPGEIVLVIRKADTSQDDSPITFSEAQENTYYEFTNDGRWTMAKPNTETVERLNHGAYLQCKVPKYYFGHIVGDILTYNDANKKATEARIVTTSLDASGKLTYQTIPYILLNEDKTRGTQHGYDFPFKLVSGIGIFSSTEVADAALKNAMRALSSGHTVAKNTSLLPVPDASNPSEVGLTVIDKDLNTVSARMKGRDCVIRLPGQKTEQTIDGADLCELVVCLPGYLTAVPMDDIEEFDGRDASWKAMWRLKETRRLLSHVESVTSFPSFSGYDNPAVSSMSYSYHLAHGEWTSPYHEDQWMFEKKENGVYDTLLPFYVRQGVEEMYQKCYKAYLEWYSREFSDRDEAKRTTLSSVTLPDMYGAGLKETDYLASVRSNLVHRVLNHGEHILAHGVLLPKFVDGMGAIIGAIGDLQEKKVIRNNCVIWFTESSYKATILNRIHDVKGVTIVELDHASLLNHKFGESTRTPVIYLVSSPDESDVIAGGIYDEKLSEDLYSTLLDGCVVVEDAIRSFDKKKSMRLAIRCMGMAAVSFWTHHGSIELEETHQLKRLLQSSIIIPVTPVNFGVSLRDVATRDTLNSLALLAQVDNIGSLSVARIPVIDPFASKKSNGSTSSSSSSSSR